MITSTDRQYHVGNTSYFTPLESPITTISLSGDGSALDTNYRPFTVVSISVDQPDVDISSIQGAISWYLSTDDVLNPDWLETILLAPSSNSSVSSATLSDDCLGTLNEQYGVSTILLDPSLSVTGGGGALATYTLASTPENVVPGPFLGSYSDGNMAIYPVYALYHDIYRTFLYGAYPQTPGKVGGPYKALRRVDSHGYNLIPVPSRLSIVGDDNGVRAKRIGVKGDCYTQPSVPILMTDLYHINGLQTNAGSRLFGDLYGPSNYTAPALERLETLGGVIVGKTKSAAFAAGSEGNGDTYDEQYPFSARSDLWQTCVGSSSGSGCAMGAYDWLDFALGTDTGGSVRGPAAYVGLYGIRPSVGAITTDGVVPLSNHSDTLGVLSRDPAAFSQFTKAWYGDSPLSFRDYPSIPQKMYVDEQYLNTSTPEAQQVIQQFISGVGQMGIEVVSSSLDGTLAERNYTWSSFTGSGAGYLASNLW